MNTNYRLSYCQSALLVIEQGNGRIHFLFHLTCLLWLCLTGSMHANAQENDAIELVGGGIKLEVTPEGKVTGTAPAGQFLVRAEAEQCNPNHMKVRTNGDGAVEIIRGLEGPQGQTCQIVERFAPTDDSLRWTVTISAEGESWTTPIKLGIEFQEPSKLQLWRPGVGSQQTEWRDPMIPTTPIEGEFRYGWPTGITLPMASMFRAENDSALSVVCSPEDLILFLDLHTTTDGFSFSHTQHRLGNGRTITFTADLFSHPEDCRGALGWITRRYPEYFDPPVPAVHAMAGCGAYSAFDEVPDVEKMKKMSFRINWWAYFDWPYLGMNLPPMTRGDEAWVCCDPYKTGIERTMTFDRLNDYARKMRAAGFFPLNYFTTTEFGTFMKGPESVNYDLPEKELWKDANSFAFRMIKDGILASKSGKPWDNGWKNGYGMDASGPNYRAFLVEQAQRQVQRLPDFSGICIDRLDWLNKINVNADDGVGWYKNGAGRMVQIGWLNMMEEVSSIFHEREKVIFANLCSSYRMEVARHFDGIYDEFGHEGHRLNASAMLCLRKPLLAWTPGQSSIVPDPDGFFHRHLYIGAYPTAPYPKNNHTINPDPKIEAHYIDYGPLLDAMRGKKWVLTPHCIAVQDDKAKANLFEVLDGWVAPVTFAPGEKSVTLLIRHVEGITDKLTVDALHPGVTEPQPVSVHFDGESLQLQVPLHRGCAMVRLQKTPQ